MLNPNKIYEFEDACQDPCKYCKMHEKAYKIGCTANPTECEKKQRQLRALEIRKYFML